MDSKQNFAELLFSRSLVEQPQNPLLLTLIEFSAQLVVGAAFHHLGDMLSFLVDRHGTDDSTLRRWGHHLDLDGACLGNLAVEFLQFSGILHRDGPVVEEGKNQQEILLHPKSRKLCPPFAAFIAACLSLATTYMTASNLNRVIFIKPIILLFLLEIKPNIYKTFHIFQNTLIALCSSIGMKKLGLWGEGSIVNTMRGFKKY